MNRRLAYLDALGVDVWLERAAAGAPQAAAVAARPAASGQSVAPARTVPEAAPPSRPPQEPLDTGAMNWSELQRHVASCTRCGLCESRTNTVFGVGDQQAPWMVIGEAPGADEDRVGEPFVGRAGQLLTAMLKAAGFERQEVFIANVLKCRPPNNRDPADAEAAACAPYLRRQIELVAPRLILAVGRIAAHRLLESTEPLGKLRGRVHQHASGVPVVVTYHPAYLLRSPTQKRKAWEDLLFAHRTANARAQ